MSSSLFAVHAGRPVSGSRSDGVDFLDAALDHSAAQVRTDGLLNPIISADVRKLVALHDTGRFDAFEVKDTSYKALLGLSKYLDSTLGRSTQTGLSSELMAQAVRFIKSVPAEQVFLRLEVTDKKPDVPDFNPAHMCAYDSERSYGTDYLQIARRLTIFGSTSSVMNNNDLGVFLEKGKKKCVVLYLGTRKNDDVQILDPSHAMALNIILTGLSQSADVQSLEKTAEAVLLHPEISELQQEASDLTAMLSEFRNSLDPEMGQELATRLMALQSTLEEISGTEALAEFLSPLSALVETMVSDDMVQEIVEHFDLSDGEPLSQELETLQSAIDLILGDLSLSKEDQTQKIVALLQVGVPSVLDRGEDAIEPLRVFLSGLEGAFEHHNILLPFPLLDQPTQWQIGHSEKLANLVLLLSDPAQIESMREALQKSPEGIQVLEALDQFSAVLDLEGSDKTSLVAKIHEALTAPTPETASLTRDLLQVISFASHPEIVAHFPEPLQLSVFSFTQETLSAQHGLAASGITETIAHLTNGTVQFEFTPPYALPVRGNDFLVLPFLVQPSVVINLSDIPADQITNYFEKISDPVLREHLQDQYEAIEILRAIDLLRGDNGKPSPQKISAILASDLAVDYTPSQDFPKVLDILIDKLGEVSSVISSVSIAGPEEAKITEALNRISSSFDFQNTDRVILIEKIHEILTSPITEATLLSNDLKYVISTIAPDVILEGKSYSPSKVTHGSLSAFSEAIQSDPAFLSSLPPEKREFIATIITKSTIERIASNNGLPVEFRRELKTALHSKDPEKLVQAINKVTESYPPHRTPPDLTILKAVAPALAVVSLIKNDPVTPAFSQVRRDEQVPPRPIIITPERDSAPSNPKSDPIKSPVPRNDNLPPPTLPTRDSSPVEPPVKRPVCPVTGAEICLCKKFNDAVKGLKPGDEKKLENGIVVRAAETKVGEDGTEIMTYTVSDNDKVIFKGDEDEIERQITDNEDKIDRKVREHKDKFEVDEGVVGVDVTSTDQVKTNPISNENEEKVNDEDIDVNFGDDELSTPSLPHLSPK